MLYAEIQIIWKIVVLLYFSMILQLEHAPIRRKQWSHKGFVRKLSQFGCCQNAKHKKKGKTEQKIIIFISAYSKCYETKVYQFIWKNNDFWCVGKKSEKYPQDLRI